MIVRPGQVWNDQDRKYRPRRQIRIERVERRGLMLRATVVARQGDQPWHAVVRTIRLDRIPKRFKLAEDVPC